MSEANERQTTDPPCSSHGYADRLVDLIDGHMTLDDDERDVIRQYALDLFVEASTPRSYSVCHKCGSVSGVYLEVCDDCMTRFNKVDA